MGWLEHGKAFDTGSVDPAVYRRLVELLKDPWVPCIFMGFHRCDLCVYDGDSGKRNLFVPGEGVVFVCPELVTHYMNAHGYRPPAAFCRAVLECPPMRSVPYLKAMMAGARPYMLAVSGRRLDGRDEPGVAAAGGA